MHKLRSSKRNYCDFKSGDGPVGRLVRTPIQVGVTKTTTAVVPFDSGEVFEKKIDLNTLEPELEDFLSQNYDMMVISDDYTPLPDDSGHCQEYHLYGQEVQRFGCYNYPEYPQQQDWQPAGDQYDHFSFPLQKPSNSFQNQFEEQHRHNPVHPLKEEQKKCNDGYQRPHDMKDGRQVFDVRLTGPQSCDFIMQVEHEKYDGSSNNLPQQGWKAVEASQMNEQAEEAETHNGIAAIQARYQQLVRDGTPEELRAFTQQLMRMAKRNKTAECAVDRLGLE